MKESQNIEWKVSWRDEYIKWLCGFANAEGGVLVVGRNDKGQPVGVRSAHGAHLPLETGLWHLETSRVTAPPFWLLPWRSR